MQVDECLCMYVYVRVYQAVLFIQYGRLLLALSVCVDPAICPSSTLILHIQEESPGVLVSIAHRISLTPSPMNAGKDIKDCGRGRQTKLEYSCGCKGTLDATRLPLALYMTDWSALLGSGEREKACVYVSLYSQDDQIL